MVIAHNMQALAAGNIIGNISINSKKSTEKLSSGYRINRAADDAAGLSISEKMRKQIRGLTRASDNSQDGISVCQIADGALEESLDMVNRIRVLAIQSANETNSTSDRQAMQNEVDELITEIDRISTTTKFNETYLLDGSISPNGGGSKTPNISVKNSANEISYSENTPVFSGVMIENMISVDPIVDSSITGATNIANAEKLSDTLKDSIVPQAVNKILGAYPVFASAFNEGMVSSNIGLKIYQESTSTLAYVSCSYSYNGANEITQISLNLSVNTRTLSFDGSGNLTEASRTALEGTVSHEMIHAFMDDTLTNGMLGAANGVLTSGEKLPKWFKEGTAQTACGAFENDNDWINNGTITGNTENGGLGITATTSIADIQTSLSQSNRRLGKETGAASYGTGYLATMYLAYMADGTNSMTSSALRNGMNTIFHKMVNGESFESIISDVSGGKYSSVSDFESKFATDSDVASFVHNLAVAVGSAGNGSLLGELNESDLIPNGNATSSAYNVYKDSEYVKSDATVRNWGSGSKATTGKNAADYPSGRIPGAPVKPLDPPKPPDPDDDGGKKPAVIDKNGSALRLQVGAEAEDGMLLYIDEMSAAGIGIDKASVLTSKEADATMKICDEAIEIILRNRSRIGAYQNRLEHTVKNLDNVVENTTAAESRIRDTDMASEMVKHSKNNILMQTAQSMLAQANQSTQGVLSLLQ